jgi:hypothetical protein
MFLKNAYTSIAPKYTQNYIDNSNVLFASNQIGGKRNRKHKQTRVQTKKSKKRCNRTMKKYRK